MAFEAFNRYKFWKKVYAERILTEEGVFMKDMLPEDYAGSEMHVEVVQRVILFEPGGNFIEMMMDDVEGVQDSERKDGVGAEINTGGEVNEMVIAVSGPSTATETWEVRVNPALTESELNAVQAMYENYQLQATTE